LCVRVGSEKSLFVPKYIVFGNRVLMPIQNFLTLPTNTVSLETTLCPFDSLYLNYVQVIRLVSVVVCGFNLY